MINKVSIFIYSALLLNFNNNNLPLVKKKKKKKEKDFQRRGRIHPQRDPNNDQRRPPQHYKDLQILQRMGLSIHSNGVLLRRRVVRKRNHAFGKQSRDSCQENTNCNQLLS